MSRSSGNLARANLGALVIFTLATGCSHQLEVLNLHDYSNNRITPGLQKIRVGILSDNLNDPVCGRLVKEVGSSLQQNSYWVILPYFPGTQQPVDAQVRIDIRPMYSGSPWNFLINWPGFMIWMPAIHGYNYTAEYFVDVTLVDENRNQFVESWMIPISLSLRHAEIDRTWTELGWFEWGFIPLIGGIIFTGYDPDVTPLLIGRIEQPIGDYIAQQIIDRLNGYGIGFPDQE